MRKRVLALSLLIATSMAFTACGNKIEVTDETEKTSDVAEVEDGADDMDVEVDVADQTGADDGKDASDESEEDKDSTDKSEEASEDNTSGDSADDVEAAKDKIAENLEKTKAEEAANRDYLADYKAGKLGIKFASNIQDATSYLEGIGDSFTSEEELLKAYGSVEGMTSGALVDKRYYELKSSDVKAYLIQYSFEGNDYYTVYNIAVAAEDHLEIKLMIDGWSRNGVCVYEKGYVTEGGSAGAGDHVAAAYIPDKNFNYTELYKYEQVYNGWDFYDPENEKANSVNAIKKEGYESGVSEDVYFGRYDIDGKDYYFYLCDGITQDTVNTLDGIAAKHGVTFDGLGTIENILEQRARDLGAEEAYADEVMISDK